jgi:hypothetical protein
VVESTLAAGPAAALWQEFFGTAALHRNEQLSDLPRLKASSSQASEIRGKMVGASDLSESGLAPCGPLVPTDTCDYFE